MTGEFLNLAGALSGGEFAELALALLRELEGRKTPRGRTSEPEESDPGSAILAEMAEKIVNAAEKRMLTAGAPASDAAGYTTQDARAGNFQSYTSEEESKVFIGEKAGFGSPGAYGANAHIRSAETGCGGIPTDLEALSESLRRDARRCDSGFERY